MAMIPADVLKLPEEIIFEILLRLPIKSLCRFRCVSKPWLALITSPTFVKTHLRRTKIQCLILASMESLYSIKLAKPIGNQLTALGVDFPPLKENPRSVSKYKFVGSCNGLLCIMLKPRAFVIFNPSTREMKRIPDIGVPTFAAKTIITVYGFGYCEQIDDFKFVKIVDSSIVWIYSLKTNSWKEGEPFHFKSMYKNRGVYLNGAIHWILSRENIGDVIVVFDLAEERFREFSLPDGVIHYELSIGVLGGHLRVTCPYDFDSNEQLWVMEEYGVKESWRRVFIQRESSDPLEPLWFWKEDEMLLARGGDHLIQCNVKDGSWQDFPVADVPAIFDAYIYEESLVSPDEIHN